MGGIYSTHGKRRATGWTADIRFPAGVRIYSEQTNTGAYLASSIMGTGTLSPGAKLQGREADHSALSTAEVKKDGAIPPLSDMSSWRGAYLITHRDNFAPFFNFTLSYNFGNVNIWAEQIVHNW
jgi:hypothetical protein